MIVKTNVIKTWKIAVRKEFIRLYQQGIYKNTFSVAELSKILNESEDLIHEYLSSVEVGQTIYHTKDKVLHFDPFS